MFLSTTGSVGTKTLTTKSGSGSAEWGKRELCGTSVGAPSLASPHVESRMSQVLLPEWCQFCQKVWAWVLGEAALPPRRARPSAARARFQNLRRLHGLPGNGEFIDIIDSVDNIDSTMEFSLVIPRLLDRFADACAPTNAAMPSAVPVEARPDACGLPLGATLLYVFDGIE